MTTKMSRFTSFKSFGIKGGSQDMTTKMSIESWPPAIVSQLLKLVNLNIFVVIS